MGILKKAALLIGAFLFVPTIAAAVNVTVPAASGSGFLLISTSTGAYTTLTASSTANIWVDGNRSDTYTQTGSIISPFKTMSATIAALPVGYSGYSINLSPATYVDGAPDTFPNLPIYLSGNEATLVEPSGITFPNSFDVYDLTIVGAVHEADTVLTAIHQFVNGVIVGNLQMDGLGTLNGEDVTGGMYLLISTSSLTNIAGSLIQNPIWSQGVSNINDDQISTNTKEALFQATTTNFLPTGQYSNVNVLGATFINLLGPAINIPNGATSTVNNLTAFTALVKGTHSIMVGNAKTDICDFESNDITGAFVAPEASTSAAWVPCYDEALNVVSTTTTANLFATANAGIGTTTANSKLLYVAGNVSGGIVRFDRVTAGVASSLFGTQDIGLWDTSPGNDLLGPAQTFTYTNGTTGVRNVLGQVAAYRTGSDSLGSLVMSANQSNAATQSLTINGSNDLLLLGTTTLGVVPSFGNYQLYNGVLRLGHSFNNFLSNSSFDYWFSGTSVAPSAWTTQGTLTIARSTSGDATTGSYSAVLNFTLSDDKIYQDFTATTSVPYTFTIWAKRVSGSGNASLIAQEEGGSFTEYVNVGCQNSVTFALCSATFTKPADGHNTVRFKFASESNTATTWQIDEAMLQEGTTLATAWLPAYLDDFSSGQNIWAEKNFASGVEMDTQDTTSSGFVSIGATSTPGSIFSVAGILNLTTATSTFYSSGGINLINGCLTYNGGTCIGATTSSASSTLLGDNNTFSGTNILSKALSLSGTTGTTTIASGQGFTVGSSQFVVQQGSGNVGIAVSSPAFPLDITGALSSVAHIQSTGQSGMADTLVLDDSGNSSVNRGTGIVFKTPTVAASENGGRLSVAAEGTIHNTFMSFYTMLSSTLAEKMRITSAGFLGVGTTTPTANLQVTTSSANATTSVQFGKANQSKGTCLTIAYDTAGSPVYEYFAAGATTPTYQNGGTAPSGCQN